MRRLLGAVACCTCVVHSHALVSRGALAPPPQPPTRVAPAAGRVNMLQSLSSSSSSVQALPSSLLVFGRERSLVAGLVEDKDVSEVSALLADSFPFEITVSTAGGFKEWEVQALSIPLALINAYLRAFSFVEILLGVKARMGGPQLQSPTLAMPQSGAVMLGVSDPATGKVVAVVELEVRVPDGTLPGNFPLPDFIKGQGADARREPYLCNLAVAPEYRGQGIGKQLVRLCEHVVRAAWGGDCLYLHVDPENDIALSLYQSMGYTAVTAPPATLPAWLVPALMPPGISYFCKPLTPASRVQLRGGAAGAAAQT